MADLRGFDAQSVEPNDSFDPLPNGDYLCIIVSSEMKPTKAGDGAYLELELQVLEGQYTGRKLWDRLNLNNSNETTVWIARGALSSIATPPPPPMPAPGGPAMIPFSAPGAPRSGAQAPTGAAGGAPWKRN